MSVPAPLDQVQLNRIESVHRGFLYQHLYAASCLLKASQVGARAVIIEHDEDIELAFEDRHLYVQVKTRGAPLSRADVSTTIDRFKELRDLHASGARAGTPAFAVIANVGPAPSLKESLENGSFGVDFSLRWSGETIGADLDLPDPEADIAALFDQCVRAAETLPFGLLSPETLIWKLAGRIMSAAAGVAPHTDHTFTVGDLPSLFEQLLVQIETLPAPPAVYRSHEDEPSVQSDDRVRIVTGYSGAGKTAWISQVAALFSGEVAYFDLTESPGTTVATMIARHLAAQVFATEKAGLSQVLMPGLSSTETLAQISSALADRSRVALVVLDNAHRVPVEDIYALVRHGTALRFLLLCHPGAFVHELEARLSIVSEPLKGWSVDVIAAESAALGCVADYHACLRLRTITGALPLYVHNAVSIAANAYGHSISAFCDDIQANTHSTETAQEMILARVFDALPETLRKAIGILSLFDIALPKDEVEAYVKTALNLDTVGFAAVLRQSRKAGCLEVFGGVNLKIHDAIRLLGESYLSTLADDLLNKARTTLKDLLVKSLPKDWSPQKLNLLLRLLIALGDIKTLVQFVSDEFFHELGARPALIAYLEKAVASSSIDKIDEFWARDGLVFAYLKHGYGEKVSAHLDAMKVLLDAPGIGSQERISYWMKRMTWCGLMGHRGGLRKAKEELQRSMPDDPRYSRILRYNLAQSSLRLGDYQFVLDESFALVDEYYEVLGLDPSQVMGRNPEDIWPLLSHGKSETDDLKHLGDALSMLALASDKLGRAPLFARVHAMKFYALANAYDSLISVGQDLVDEFVERRDYIGARELIEGNLLPNVQQLQLASKIVSVRSQYAVILAMCGDLTAADAEMQRLMPYESGLESHYRQELRNQRKLIDEIRVFGVRSQREMPNLEGSRRAIRAMAGLEP